MPNFPTFRRTKVGRFGTAYIVVDSGPIGGANFLGGASPLTANNTTTFRMPTPPIKCVFWKLAAHCVTIPADADGTILARAMKYNAATTTASAVSADIDLKALVTRQLTQVGTLSTATNPTLIFNGGPSGAIGDTLEINVVNNSAAIDTQPAGLIFTAVFLALE